MTTDFDFANDPLTKHIALLDEFNTQAEANITVKQIGNGYMVAAHGETIAMFSVMGEIVTRGNCKRDAEDYAGTLRQRFVQLAMEGKVDA